MPSRPINDNYSSISSDSERGDCEFAPHAGVGEGLSVEALFAELGIGREVDKGVDQPTRSTTAAERSNKVTNAISKPLSDKVTARKRRSDKKDIQALERIQKFDPSTVAVKSDGSLVVIYPPSISPLTVWDLTSDRQKLVHATLALDLTVGKASSWSFNLTPESEKKWQAHPKGFVGAISRAINRQCQRQWGYIPLYWFSVHVHKNRLHLHGAAALDAEEVLAFGELLKVALGRATGKAALYQFHDNPQRCDDGWAVYAIKGRGAVKKILGDHTFYLPDELRRRGKHTYGEMRSIVR